MRVVMVIWVIGAVGLGFGFTSRTAIAAAECTELSPSSLKVYTISTGVKVESDVDGAIPDRPVDSVDTGANDPHPYLIIVARIGAQHVIDGSTASRGDVHCASPKEIRIGIGLIKRIVRLPAAAAADMCVRDTLLRHAALHTDAQMRVTERFVASTDEMFGRTLEMLKVTPAATANEAQRNFDRGVRDLVDRAAQLLKSQLKDASAAIDTVDELEHLRGMCDGKLELLGRSPVAIPQ